jgi:hypothetical protein
MSDNTQSETLLPCPFCGCVASIYSSGSVFRDGPAYRVECEGDCHGMTCWWHSIKQAVRAWNRRPTGGDNWARSELIRIAAACARFQHLYVDELEQNDLKQFGDYANRLKKLADSICK